MKWILINYGKQHLIKILDLFVKVKIDEVNEANALFETLMGEVVEGRKNFIQENSLKVANLDI